MWPNRNWRSLRFETRHGRVEVEPANGRLCVFTRHRAIESHLFVVHRAPYVQIRFQALRVAAGEFYIELAVIDLANPQFDGVSDAFSWKAGAKPIITVWPFSHIGFRKDPFDV